MAQDHFNDVADISRANWMKTLAARTDPAMRAAEADHVRNEADLLRAGCAPGLPELNDAMFPILHALKDTLRKNTVEAIRNVEQSCEVSQFEGLRFLTFIPLSMRRQVMHPERAFKEVCREYGAILRYSHCYLEEVAFYRVIAAANECHAPAWEAHKAIINAHDLVLNVLPLTEYNLRVLFGMRTAGLAAVAGAKSAETRMFPRIAQKAREYGLAKNHHALYPEYLEFLDAMPKARDYPDLQPNEITIGEYHVLTPGNIMDLDVIPIGDQSYALWFDMVKAFGKQTYDEQKHRMYDQPAEEWSFVGGIPHGVDERIVLAELLKPANLTKANLSPNEREIIDALRENPEYGNQDLALMLGRDTGQIAVEKHRAFDKLRRLPP